MDPQGNKETVRVVLRVIVSAYLVYLGYSLMKGELTTKEVPSGIFMAFAVIMMAGGAGFAGYSLYKWWKDSHS
ncbi:MAG: hypothetical protein K6A92_07940 [Lachnospiraceae bacterium]|nr:hypothetical protein [Lachnospiraceae bacterium]